MIRIIVLAAALSASAASSQQPVTDATQAAPAAPAAPAVASNPAPATAAADKSKVICEKEEVTGSRLQSHRVCLTSDQWREVRRQERLDVEHDQKLGKNGGH